MRKLLTAALGALLCASFTISSASAMTVADELGWNDTYDGFTPGAGHQYDGDNGEDPRCGSGTKTLCGYTKKTTCVEWVVTSITIGGSQTGANGGLTKVCKVQVETLINLFFP